jgi:UDP-N-acetyl-D-mannosaminuronic acid dehydrogenase
VTDCVDQLIPHLSDDQTLILRSTVFPGVTELVDEHLRARGKHAKVAFCPERVVQGQATRELQSLPQIISGMTPEAEEVAADIFSRFAPKVVRMVPKEAEFAKLFSNAYRYIQFAAANQFYVMVESEGLDYQRVLTGLKADYPRLRDLPGPGFAAGPCLYKDTLQLASFANNQFALGQAAININEGLPDFIVAQLRKRFALEHLTVGILGMAFKADSDDTRSSLSYKLKRLLRVRARKVLTTDPFVRTDPTLLPIDEVLDRSDLLIVGVPHSSYRAVDLHNKPVVDLWGLYGGSILPEPRPGGIAPDMIVTAGAARRTS